MTVMALFGLLWVMRIRAEVRKDKRNGPARPRRPNHPVETVLPPPVSFADTDSPSPAAEETIPPPPPPPSIIRRRQQQQQQKALIHRSASRDRLFDYDRSRPLESRQQSRSAQNLPLECTCPTAFIVRPQQRVRFRDDPFGLQSARPAGKMYSNSWDYPSVISTLPRQRRLLPLAVGSNQSRSSQGSSSSPSSVQPLRLLPFDLFIFLLGISSHFVFAASLPCAPLLNL